MPWSTPKTNWQSADVVLPADFNRIEGNTSYLKNVLDGVEVQNITFPGTFTVGGAVTLQNIANIVGNVWMQSNLDVRGTLTVGGAVTLQNTLTVQGSTELRGQTTAGNIWVPRYGGINFDHPAGRVFLRNEGAFQIIDPSFNNLLMVTLNGQLIANDAVIDNVRVHRHPYSGHRHIESGSVFIPRVTTVGITFTRPFTAPPNVTVGVRRSIPIEVIDPSTTGVTLRNDQSGIDTMAYWIAEGPG